MKNQFLILLFAVLTFNRYSQIGYENGYFIKNSNKRITCLIKNIDWDNNPSRFNYKLTKNPDKQTATTQYVKKIGIDNKVKYIRDIVDIDKSGTVPDQLSSERNPIFQKEQLFLKVLVGR